ncbi:alpha-2-macroglobulin family protein [Budvicia diplopodorum]|uniref:alpha-2-macroglobulin family protein n=1 Tax=Budvicia diplopodorum TaxID=1119056 RepID=UPI00135B335C|nr:alpha-2-macroglobulin [Budvicia diplopodorum]
MDLLRFILRLPLTLLRAAYWFICFIFGLLAALLRPLIGRANWQAPGWSVKVRHIIGNGIQATERWINKHPVGILIGLILSIAAAGASFYGYHWYLNRPKPIEAAPMVYQQTNVQIQGPAALDYGTEQPQRVALYFSNSSAPIALVGKTIDRGITMTPAIDGEWKWESASLLVFTAKKAFPMGEKYQVNLDAATLVAPQIKLNSIELAFTTAPFDINLSKTEFYQDPRNPQQKSAIFSVKFNAPVDVLSFEKQITMSLLPSQPLKYSIIYNDKKTEAWVHSQPLALPDNPGQIRLSIGKGVKAVVAANQTQSIRDNIVNIPGLYSLELNDIESVLAESETNKGQKALLISTSDAVNQKEIQKAVKAWLLPQHNPNADAQASPQTENDFYRWSMSNIDEKVRSQSTPLALTINDAEQDNQPLFSFSFNAPAYRYLLVEVADTLTSAGGYKLKNKEYRVVTVPDYPKVLRFMSEGSLLSMKGEKQITVVNRNQPGLLLDIKRVIPSQLQHVVSFKNNTFTAVDFNRLDDSYFTERFQYKTKLDNDKPEDLAYQGIDLSRYLSKDPNARRGIFLLTLSGWDPANGEKANNNDDSYDGNDPDAVAESESDSENVTDSRFVVITDLGIMAKRSLDGSRDIFVQSIHSGTPVQSAKVSVIAKNGSVLFIRTTGADGHASFPSLAAFINERSPVMFLIEKEGDVSFLPTNNDYDRTLDFSRFDIYGEVNPTDPRTLSSYLFSDRGIYRPGDTFNVGLITRPADWKTSLTGIPLKAEIQDPRGTVMSTVALTLDNSGFNELSYTTGENAPTGDWSVYLYLQNSNESNGAPLLLGSTTVKVKEFEPDKLKVSLTLTPDRQQGWVKPQELKANIDVQNLFGTPAQDRRVASKLTLRPIYPSFTQYPDYQFYENRNNQDGFETDLEDQTTDQNGLAEIKLDIGAYADATYQLQLISEAFETGSGRSVTAAARVIVSPYDYLVGVKADGDIDYINHHAERHLSIIAVDPSLAKLELPDLTLSLLEQTYLSVLTKQPSGSYKYQSKLKESLISERPLTILPTGSDLKLATDRPGNFILQIKNAKGQVLNRINYSVAGNANVSRSLDRNAELKLKLNKPEYQANDEIEVAINAPYAGSGIITIERDKVYSWQWFHSNTTSSVQKIKIPAGMEGNGYVNVQFIRDLNSDEIFMSPLSYGVMPFKISNDARQAKISLSSPALIKPGQTLPIKVTTHGPQRVAVFAVDEGILQVARYHLNDPLDYFFRKRELSVQSAQILDLILPEFSKIMSLTSAPGGDAGESLSLHLNPFKRKTDKPVAYWSGITDVNGEATFDYPVPDYFNGKIRVMAISVTPDRIGHYQTSTTVRDDFILTPNLPTSVSPGDEFDVSVSVANSLTTLNGEKAELLVTLTPPAQLQVMGEPERLISLAEKQEGMVTFRLKALNALGNAPVTVKTSYRDKSAQRTVSLSVRPAMPFRTQSVMGRMDGKQQNIDNIRQMFPDYARRNAVLSHSPMILSNGLAKYLSDYPYSCSEQIVSRSIPLLFQQHQEIASELNDAQAREQVKNIVTTLLSRQNSEGAIGMWQSTQAPDPFITPYVVQFLLEAKEQNYPVSEPLLKSANDYLRKLATSDSRRSLYDLRLRAFSVYLLTRQGEITTNMLASVQSRLQANYPNVWQQDLSALYLASSYKMLKMDKQADEMLKPTWAELSKAYDKAWWSHEYLDPLVLDSTRIYLIVRHFPQKAQDIPPQALENMVLSLKAQRYTTLSSAMSILALNGYSSMVAEQHKDQNGLTITETGSAKGAQPRLISSLSGLVANANFTKDTKEITFNNAMPTPAWYVMTQSGYDANPPKQAISKGLEIAREYTDESGAVVSQIALGQKINVHLKIRSNSKEGQDNLAIVDLLPGGFEVVQQTQPQARNEGEESQQDDSGDDLESHWNPLMVDGSSLNPEYTDIREDRVVIYGRATDSVQEFIYQIKPTNAGTFTIPPAYAEAMYDREIQAMSAGGGSIMVEAPTAKESETYSPPCH